jgi:hypothetical protein
MKVARPAIAPMGDQAVREIATGFQHGKARLDGRSVHD